MSRLRRPPLRVWVWTAAALAVVVVAGLLWRGSDAAATTSTTAGEPAVASGSPAAELAVAWTTTPTGPAPDRAVESGRAVLAQDDGFRVLDPATGDEAWRYTRSNARLCGVTTVSDRVVALFSTGGRCNEMVAFDAGTGVRTWYRSAGFAADATLSSTQGIVLARSAGGVATVDPIGNGTRWRYEVPEGCRLTDAVVGSSGVAVLQRCGEDASSAVLFDGIDGTQLWSRDLGVPEARLTGADRLVGVVAGDALQALSPADGTTLQDVPLPAAGGDGPLQQAGTDDAVLVWARSTVLVLDATTGALRWSLPAVGLPAVDEGGKTPDGAVLVPEDGAFVRRQLATGDEVSRSTAPTGAPVGGRAAVVGSTVVLATAEQVTAYR
ncbi:PQQ-binding-like beta-propeller repeat protein [Geodermatophilus sp. Leaf369]|uniref:outer membrane protein assembly factor BamB family protein n=1 Tax=Geodermatophilus sp. Leaf369 TaxID=1736354 RepID=UPI000AB7C806|nr:PQQ-binding-like beta-propeller repeat protein [Geodermatophilus sp. Leaf369]